MVKQLKKIAVYLVEWHMLRIYAAIMTTLFFSIWIPAMIMVFKEMIKTFWQYDTKQNKTVAKPVFLESILPRQKDEGRNEEMPK